MNHFPAMPILLLGAPYLAKTSLEGQVNKARTVKKEVLWLVTVTSVINE